MISFRGDHRAEACPVTTPNLPGHRLHGSEVSLATQPSEPVPEHRNLDFFVWKPGYTRNEAIRRPLLSPTQMSPNRKAGTEPASLSDGEGPALTTPT